MSKSKGFFDGISLDDVDLRRKLNKKLEEYKKRKIQNEGRSTQVGTDAEYKSIILAHVLKKKKVTTEEVSREVEKVGLAGWGQMFEEACLVIADYCKTGGKGNLGGTGFQNDEQKKQVVKMAGLRE